MSCITGLSTGRCWRSLAAHLVFIWLLCCSFEESSRRFKKENKIASKNNRDSRTETWTFDRLQRWKQKEKMVGCWGWKGSWASLSSPVTSPQLRQRPGTNIDKRDERGRFLLHQQDTPHRHDTKRSNENPYLSPNLTKTLYRSNVEVKLSARSLGGDAPPTPHRWWGWRTMMLFKAQPRWAALKRLQCVAPSSSVLSAPRAETSSAVLHASDQKPCCSAAALCSINYPPARSPWFKERKKKLLRSHRCPKTMLSSCCIFYERNGQ